MAVTTEIGNRAEYLSHLGLCSMGQSAVRAGRMFDAHSSPRWNSRRAGRRGGLCTNRSRNGQRRGDTKPTQSAGLSQEFPGRPHAPPGVAVISAPSGIRRDCLPGGDLVEETRVDRFGVLKQQR